MRGDYLFLIASLSIISVTLTYYGSLDDGKRVIYDTASNLKKRLHKNLRDKMPECCSEMTKECLSCATGLLIKDFCQRHKGEYGCPATNNTSSKPVVESSKPVVESTVDVVYLWVNGTKNKPRDTTGLNEVSSANRFREWKELQYSIELLRENGEGLGNIYVITNGNRPNYPNLKDVLFIDHDEFIPKKYLPTFSSYTIQFNLDGIFHKVSDPFVLLDDDFFITKKLDLLKYTKKNVWFTESWGQTWKDDTPTSNHFVKAIQNSNKALKKVYKNFKQFGCISHTPVVIHHKIFSKMKNLIDTTVSMTPYRSKSSLQFQYTLAGVSKYSFGHILKGSHGLYHFVMMNNIMKLKQSFANIARSRRKFLTINDDIQRVTSHAIVIDTFLRGLVLKSNELKRIDVDNSMSSDSGDGTVLFFNALRGRMWEKTCKLLKDHNPSLILLNEMDWGMARTDNEHTTKRLAQCLQMNYMFGVEFIELTKGNAREEKMAAGKENTWSWHGNAILSKNKIVDPQIIRLPGTEQFWKKGLRGKEQRNGGRMAIAAKVGDTRVICTHLDYFVGQAYNQKSLKTLGKMFKDKKIILGGDLGTPGRDPKTPDVLTSYGYTNAWTVNTRDKSASGDWIMTKGVQLNKAVVVSSGEISDHNVIVSKKENFFFLENCPNNSYSCRYYDKSKNVDMFGVIKSYNTKIVHGKFEDEVMDISEANTNFQSFVYISAMKHENNIYVSTIVSLGSQCGIFKVTANKIKDVIRGDNSLLKREYPEWTNSKTKEAIKKFSPYAKDYSVLNVRSFEDCSINKQGNEFFLRTREGKHVIDTKNGPFVSDPKGYTFYISSNMTGPFALQDIKFKDSFYKLHYASDTSVTMYRDINGILRTTVRKELPYYRGSSRGYRGIAFLYQCGSFWCEQAELHIDRFLPRKYGPQIYSSRVSKIGNMYFLVLGLYYAHGKPYKNKQVEAEIAIVPSNDGIYFDVRYAYTIIEESQLFRPLYSTASASNLVEDHGKYIYFQSAAYNTHGDGYNFNRGILKRPLVIKRSIDKDKLFGLYSDDGYIVVAKGKWNIITDCNITRDIDAMEATTIPIKKCTIYKVNER